MGGLMQEAGIVSLGWDHIPAVGFSTQTQPLWTRGSTLQPDKLEFSLHSLSFKKKKKKNRVKYKNSYVSGPSFY